MSRRFGISLSDELYKQFEDHPSRNSYASIPAMIRDLAVKQLETTSVIGLSREGYLGLRHKWERHFNAMDGISHENRVKWTEGHIKAELADVAKVTDPDSMKSVDEYYRLLYAFSQGKKSI